METLSTFCSLVPMVIYPSYNLHAILVSFTASYQKLRSLSPDGLWPVPFICIDLLPAWIPEPVRWESYSFLCFCWSFCFHFLSKVQGKTCCPCARYVSRCASLTPGSHPLPSLFVCPFCGLRNPQSPVVPLVLHLCPYVALRYPFCRWLASATPYWDLPSLGQYFCSKQPC